MADPGKHSEFSPEELDRLEDALERWTGPDVGPDSSPVPEDSLLAPSLRARLEDYRSLLTQVRSELPMEDVSDGLLAEVLAEAHHGQRGGQRGGQRAGDEQAPTHEPGPRELAGPSFWERLRRSLLLPGFALAGSAALLLWMVQPGEDAAPTLAQNDAPRPEAARLAPDARPAPAAAQEPDFDAGAADRVEANAEEKSADAPGTISQTASGGQAMAPAAAPPADPAAPKDMLDAKADRKGMTKSKKAEAAGSPSPIESYPGLDDVPSVDGDKEALRDTLEQADAARRKGRCSEALGLYLEAMKMSGADSERAMARAGYGLCLMAQGDDTGADKYFESARKLSPSIDGWIKRERGDSPAKKAPSPKPSARSKIDDPFK